MSLPTVAPPALASSSANVPGDGGDVVLAVHEVSKHYKLWNSPSERLRYSMLSQAHRTLRTVLPAGSTPLTSLRRRRDALHRDFTALHTLSFEVRRGESLGIIGRNGAGKSTLLQIIAGTLRPSTGHVEVRGQVAALLELGSGFNMEYTGRENVYLSASILGFTKAEIDARFDEVASFADIGRFLDQPIKTYSSGMMVRLAFSVQMAVDPAIFIIDEALAVGDIYFQSKCNKLLRQKLDAGLTLLLVSHNTASVRALCGRGLVLDRGRCAFLGASDQAVNAYHELGDQRGEDRPPERDPLPGEDGAMLASADDENEEAAMPALGQIEDEIGSREVVITGCGLFNARGEPCRDFAVGETIHAGFTFRSQIDVEGIMTGYIVRNHFGSALTGLTTANQGLDLPPLRRGGVYTIFLMIPGRLGPGEYLLDFGVGGQPSLVGSPEIHYHRIGGIATFTVAWHDRQVRFVGACNVDAEFRPGRALSAMPVASSNLP